MLEDLEMEDLPTEMIEVQVDVALEENVMALLREEMANFHAGRLLPPLRPLEYNVSTRSLQGRVLPTSVFPPPLEIYTDLSLCYTSSSLSSTPPSFNQFLLWIALAQAEHGRAARVRLESFPSSLLSELVSWIEGSRKQKHSDPYWKMSLVSWTDTFVWELEDGSIFEIDASVSLFLSDCPAYPSASRWLISSLNHFFDRISRTRSSLEIETRSKR